MEHNIQKSLQIYKQQLNDGYIQAAYVALMKYTAELKGNFPKQYQTGNLSFGYLDYTYFPFLNPELRNRKLRFGVVLNHQKLRFELWLMGQNADVQKTYWEILKNSPWNSGRTAMPKYAVLEVVLEDQIDFDCKEAMTKNILSRAVSTAAEVQAYLEKW